MQKSSATIFSIRFPWMLVYSGVGEKPLCLIFALHTVFSGIFHLLIIEINKAIIAARYFCYNVFGFYQVLRRCYSFSCITDGERQKRPDGGRKGGLKTMKNKLFLADYNGFWGDDKLLIFNKSGLYCSLLFSWLYS